METAAAGANDLHIIDNSSSPTMIRQEVLCGVLEILRDASGGPQLVIQRIGLWMRKFTLRGPQLEDDLSRIAHQNLLLLLLRGKMLQAVDVDLHFVANMGGGNNLLWVELALSVVRQCIVDGLAATSDFASTFDVVSKMRPSNAAVRKQLQKWLVTSKLS